MKKQILSTALDSDFLSNIELYYTEPENVNSEELLIYGEEHSHITRVMRHSINDELYVTNGKGNIYQTIIIDITKEFVRSKIQSVINYNNPFENYVFCIPKLKSADRFEFALEKCVELGITNFVIYDAQRSISKGNKPDRWNKILLSSMKQSLRSFLPEISMVSSLQQIINSDGIKIVFEQNVKNNLCDLSTDKQNKYFFIFGPEGGLGQKELSLVREEDIYNITPNRLRSETAIVTAAACLTMK